MLLDPATGNNFFGRDDILALLKKRADGLRFGYRQNVAIIGPSYYGKTSVIYRFISTLPFKDTVPVYIEVKNQGFPAFAEKFIAALLFRYLDFAEFKAAGTGGLVSLAADRMPKTAKAVKAIETLIKGGKNLKAYRALFELPATAYSETGLRPIIILDEFHRIADLGIEDAFAELGKFIMLQKDTMYIVLSSQINQAKNILAEKLSLLFGNFEIYELGTFDVRTASQFIRARLVSGPLPDELVNFLVAFSDGHPFYLDSILLSLRGRGGNITAVKDTDTLTAMFIEILFDSKGILNQHFSGVMTRLDGIDRHSAAVLLAISNGAKKVQAISEASRVKTAELSALLEKLIDAGWVSRQGKFYLIRDKVFELWLRNVYQIKEYLLDPSYEPKISMFSAEVKGFIENFVESSARDIDDLVAGLFTSFNGEFMELGGKSFRLPHFGNTEARASKIDGISYLSLFAEGCTWELIVGRRPVRDSDVMDYLSQCKGRKSAVKRKIVIALAGMGANAKLLAKEAKCWIWDLKDLNTLLDMTGRQRLVLPQWDAEGIAESQKDHLASTESA
ncbi:MAG: hypothetical protein WC317_01355 [Candidatus Omnitrophota bacterium]|jgi:hypothetical protein